MMVSLVQKVQRGVTSALLIAAFSIPLAQAQSPAVQAARQTLEQQETPKETVASYQAALTDILDLTKVELDDALSADKLGGLPVRVDASLAAQARVLQQYLRLYQVYVRLVRAQVQRPTQTVDQLKQIAAGLKVWREQLYTPTLRQGFDTLLVSQGADVVGIAQRRLDRVSTDVKRLQSSKGAAADALVPLFESARDHIATAGQIHDTARTALMSGYQQVISQTALPGVSAPTAVTLARGAGGDFVCASETNESFRGGVCAVAFKKTTGGMYAVFTQNGEVFTYAIGDVAKISGTLLPLTPVFADDTVTGVVMVELVNRAPANESVLSPSRAVVTAATTADEEPVSIQAMTKAIIDDITLAYKDFFAMSKKAQQLLGR